MNEPTDQRRRLAADVAAEDEGFGRFETSLRRQALACYRRAIFLRRVRRVTACAAALVLLGSLGWMVAQRGQAERFEPSRAGGQAAVARPMAVAPPSAGTAPAPSNYSNPRLKATSTNAPPVHLLSDSELLAAFPPDSCFLAEVNGRTIVVFYDPAVEARFFQ